MRRPTVAQDRRVSTREGNESTRVALLILARRSVSQLRAGVVNTGLRNVRLMVEGSPPPPVLDPYFRP